MSERKLQKESLVKSLKNPESTHYKYCKNKGVNPKDIDWDSLLDSSLNGSENWDKVEEEVMKRANPEVKAEEEFDPERVEKFEKEMEEKHLEHLEEKKEEEIKKEFEKDDTDVASFYGRMPDYVRGVAKGPRDAMMIEADPGIGKTHQIKSILNDTVGRKGYEHIQGVSSPLKFYKILYNNKDKVIFVDDIEGLINNKRAKGILKQATWSAVGSSKKVSWNSTTSRLDEVDPEFMFEGEIIMCFNEIPEDDKIFDSLKDRCFFMNLEMTYEQKIKLLREIAENTGKKRHLRVPKDQRIEIVDWLKEQVDPTTEDFNLRTFDDCIDCWIMDKELGIGDWRHNVKGQINRNEKLAKVLNLIRKEKKGEFDTQKEAIEQYCEDMGKSKSAGRREFFRKKKELKRKSEVIDELESGSDA